MLLYQISALRIEYFGLTQYRLMFELFLVDFHNEKTRSDSPNHRVTPKILIKLLNNLNVKLSLSF